MCFTSFNFTRPSEIIKSNNQMIPIISITNPCLLTLKKQVTEMGVFYVKSGISKAESRAVFDAAERLFDVPTNFKDSLGISPSGFTRGYVGYGKESGSDLFESKEGWYWLNPKLSLTVTPGIQKPNHRTLYRALTFGLRSLLNSLAMTSKY
jgi:non-haem dioxygenase in morphine synthesis N-terminal